MNIEPGQKAPDFTLPTDGNGKVTLSQLAGKKVVLYFYPKDDTSGCTAEACGFRDSFPDYGGVGAVVIGISKDRSPRTTSSRKSTISRSSWPPIPREKSARNMAPGSKRACMAANTWASTAALF